VKLKYVCVQVHWQCVICEKMFRSEKALVNHERCAAQNPISYRYHAVHLLCRTSSGCQPHAAGMPPSPVWASCVPANVPICKHTAHPV